MDIVLSAAARRNILVLQATAAQQAQASSRLASGLKVETALDDPTSFFTARQVNARADALRALLDGYSNAQSSLEVADHANKASLELLEQMEVTVDLALKQAKGSLEVKTELTGTTTLNLTDDFNTLVSSNLLSGPLRNRRLGIGATGGNGYRFFQYNADGTTIGDFITWANSTAIQSVTQVGVSLNANGNMHFERVDGGSEPIRVLSYTGEMASDLGIPGSGYHWGSTADLRRTITGWRSGLTATTKFGELDVGGGPNNGGGNITWGDGQGNSFSFAASGTNTVGDLITAVNADPNFGWAAGLDGDGRLVLTSDTGVNNFIITPQPWFQYHQNMGLLSPHGNSSAGGPGSTTAAVASPSQLAPPSELHQRYLDLRGQYETVIRDASFAGANIPIGDPQRVELNEKGASLTLAGRPLGANALGLDAPDRPEFLTIDGLTAISERLAATRQRLEANAALLATQTAIIGVRDGFTKGLIDTLRAGASVLILADANEEGAKLLATDTRSQLATQSLSLSTQADQSVLRLFG